MKPAAVRTALAAALVLGAGSVLFAATPPPGFVETVLLSSAEVAAPVAAAYEPGAGHLWVLEKGSSGSARVRRRAAGTGVVTTALTLGCVNSSGERGLLGIAFDPRYLEPGGAARWVYLFYTRTFDAAGCGAAGRSGSHNRVSRFTESGGQLSGEQLILEGEQLGATNHNGGTLRFAPDGTLFVSFGDNDTDGPAQGQLSRDLTDLRGKLVRVTPDGSIPPDNPFVGAGGGVREEIWAFGLRNHFRFDIDPVTGTPYLGDVGEGNWEAIYAGISGADYGYPCFEGSHTFRACNPSPAAGTVVGPVFEYNHDWTAPFSSSSVTGGPVYRAGIFPAEYHRNYFFGEFVDDWVRRGRIGPDHQIVDVELFLADAFGVTDLLVSPAGCLTWVSIVGEGVREVCPDPALANGPPRAVAAADTIGGLAPLSVAFSGSSSSDPDMDPLSYDWQLGDGSPSSAADPMHTYSVDGVYEAVLTVDDQQGEVNSEDISPPIRIVVGNRPPTSSITAPAAGASYSAGDTITYSGGASDPEDGALAAARLRWTAVLLRDGESWPVAGPHAGVAAGGFTVPITGAGSGVGALRIYLTATDLGVASVADSELADSAWVELTPDLVEINLVAEPAAEPLQVALDGTTAAAPYAEDSVVGSRRSLAAPSPQTIGDTRWVFDSWSDGLAAEHTIDTPAVDTVYSADFRCGLRVVSAAVVDQPGVTIAGCDSWALGPDWRVTGAGGATVEASDSIELRNGVVVEADGQLVLSLVP